MKNSTTVEQNAIDTRDEAVSFYRVMAMLMIVGCHLANTYGIASLAQLMITGVEMFLFLSGWLYGGKEIHAPGIWLWNRVAKVCFPAIVWSMIVYLLYAIIVHRYASLGQILTSLFNLQGLSVIANMGLPTTPCAHLWFITIIMMCYILTIFLDKYITYEVDDKSVIGFVVLGGLLVAVLCYWGIYLRCFLCYTLGFLMRRAKISMRGKSYWIFTVVTVCVSVIRLICRAYWDGTILYDDIISQYNKIILAIWLFYSVYNLNKQNNIIRRITSTKTFGVLEKTNFYIYLTHYVFLVGSLAVSNYMDGVAYQMMVWLGLTIVFTLLMYGLDILIQKKD